MSAFRKRLIRDGIIILLWPYLSVALVMLIAWIAEHGEAIDRVINNILRKLV